LAGEGRRCGAVQWALGSGSLALSLSAAGGVAAPTTERAERNREGFPPAQVGGRFGRWGWAETEAQWPTPHPHRTRHGNGVGWDCGAQQQHAPEHACVQTSLSPCSVREKFSKKMLQYPLYQILRYIYGALNVDEKKLITEFG